MEAKKREHPVYTEQYKSQAVELMIHSGKSVVQIARELGCGEVLYSPPKCILTNVLVKGERLDVTA